MKRLFSRIISQTTHLFKKVFSKKPIKKEVSGLSGLGVDAKKIGEVKTGYLSAEESAKIIHKFTHPDSLRERYKNQDELFRKLREVFPFLPFSGISLLLSWSIF